MEGGEEVATRMTVVIGILGEGGATSVVATGTGTMIEALVVGQKVPLVAVRPKMVGVVVVMVVNQVVAMATTISAAAMDRVILVLQETRSVPLVTKTSRVLLSMGACRGPLRTA